MKKNEKYNMNIEPKLPNWFWFHCVIKLMSHFMSGKLGTKTKINKINCEGLKTPYLIFANHASFIDFPNLALAMKQDRACWVASVEEFIGIREFLFDKACVIPKRKFTNDAALIKKIVRATRNNISMAIYPEARFSLAGVNEDIGTGCGKLAKMCCVPVIVFNQRGNFLRSPQWNKHPYRKCPMEADFIQVCTKEETQTLTAEEIQQRIEKAFVYDEYKWQKDNNIRITSKYRAHNIHKVLYKCPVCGDEHHMHSEKTMLWCDKCNSKWEMTELGELQCLTGENKFTHVPDWYNWERAEVRKEVEANSYCVKEKVRVEKLINQRVGFKVYGEAEMIHDVNGYHFNGQLTDGTSFTFDKHPLATRSMHIEYDYKERGDALDIVYNDETYFVYPLLGKSTLTKYHFATEEIFFNASKK